MTAARPAKPRRDAGFFSALDLRQLRSFVALVGALAVRRELPRVRLVALLPEAEPPRAAVGTAPRQAGRRS